MYCLLNFRNNLYTCYTYVILRSPCYPLFGLPSDLLCCKCSLLHFHFIHWVLQIQNFCLVLFYDFYLFGQYLILNLYFVCVTSLKWFLNFFKRAILKFLSARWQNLRTAIFWWWQASSIFTFPVVLHCWFCIWSSTYLNLCWLPSDGVLLVLLLSRMFSAFVWVHWSYSSCSLCGRILMILYLLWFLKPTRLAVGNLYCSPKGGNSTLWFLTCPQTLACFLRAFPACQSSFSVHTQEVSCRVGRGMGLSLSAVGVSVDPVGRSPDTCS